VTFTFGGKAGQVETNAVPIKVEGQLGDVVDDPKAMRDFAPPTELSSRDWFWVWIGAAIGAVVGGSIALVLWRRSRRRTLDLTGGTLPAGRLDTPGERALARLLKIERSGVLERDGERKAGYNGMVDVIREYVGARYRVATRDLTTMELMRKLAGLAPTAERSAVEAWLERCDVVKYGGLRPGAADANAVLAEARALVVSTTVPPREEAAA
jgi:hypothetical protein